MEEINEAESQAAVGVIDAEWVKAHGRHMPEILRLECLALLAPGPVRVVSGCPFIRRSAGARINEALARHASEI